MASSPRFFFLYVVSVLLLFFSLFWWLSPSLTVVVIGAHHAVCRQCSGWHSPSQGRRLPAPRVASDQVCHDLNAGSETRSNEHSWTRLPAYFSCRHAASPVFSVIGMSTFRSNKFTITRVHEYVPSRARIKCLAEGPSLPSSPEHTPSAITSSIFILTYSHGQQPVRRTLLDVSGSPTEPVV